MGPVGPLSIRRIFRTTRPLVREAPGGSADADRPPPTPPHDGVTFMHDGEWLATREEDGYYALFRWEGNGWRRQGVSGVNSLRSTPAGRAAWADAIRRHGLQPPAPGPWSNDGIISPTDDVP